MPYWQLQAAHCVPCLLSFLALLSAPLRSLLPPLSKPALCLQLEALLMEICDETSIAELKLKVSPLAALYP